MLLSLPIALAPAAGAAQEDRVEILETRIAALEGELNTMKAELESLRSGVAPRAEAVPEEVAPLDRPPFIEHSGFLEVLGDASNFDAENFSVGQFEYDVNVGLANGVSGSGAFVFEDGAATLGVGFLDVHIGGRAVGPRGRIFGERGFHVQIGRFDIPFGLDYNFLAPPDRTTIAAPLLTERTFDGGLNGDGLRILGTPGPLQYTFYGTSSLLSEGGFSAGGRLGLELLRNVYSLHREAEEGLTVGVSGLVDWGPGWTKGAHFVGADVEYFLGPVALSGEWVGRFELGTTTSTYYGQVVLGIGSSGGLPRSLFGRYDRGEAREELLSAGVNLGFAEGAFFKLENGRYLSFGRLDAEEEGLARNSVRLQWVLSV
jgi:hypothetical protein